MKIIDREMKVVESATNKSNYSLNCQASFNSDGDLREEALEYESKIRQEVEK